MMKLRLIKKETYKYGGKKDKTMKEILKLKATKEVIEKQVEKLEESLQQRGKRKKIDRGKLIDSDVSDDF